MIFDEWVDRRIPLTVVAALFLQAGTGIWWAATKDSDDRFQQQRIDVLDRTLTQTKDGQILMLERLARIEERTNAQISLLDRIEKQLGASGH